MERILEMAKKVSEQADVYYVTSDETPLQFETNRLKHAQSKQSTIVGVRLVRNGRIGYSAGTSLDEGKSLVDMAAATAEFGMAANFEMPGVTDYPHIDIFDTAVESLPLETMAGQGDEAIAILRKFNPELQCDAWTSKGVVTVRIINSRGGHAEYKETYSNLAVSANLIRGTDMLFVGESEYSCHPVLSAKSIAGTVVNKLEMAVELAKVSTGTLPVIFTPDGVAGAFIPALTAAFNGKLVLEGASPIGTKLGQQLFDDKLQLWDDPTLAYRPTSRPCDDEGVPSRKLPLIESGRVANFYYDLQTAAMAGKTSTGHGNRGRGGLPVPSPTALVMNSGKATLEEMIKDVKEGLVVDDLMGADQGNVLGGDFAGNVLLGYKIENGKIVGRVKDTMVSGNIYKLLKDIAAVGEAKWVGGGLFLPPLYFSAVSVASKG